MDRIEDKSLRKKYRSMPCQLCLSRNEVSGHHIKSRGAWGPDLEENLIALCFPCHTKIHLYGKEKLSLEYPCLKTILMEKGWEVVTIGGIPKWLNDKVLV